MDCFVFCFFTEPSFIVHNVLLYQYIDWNLPVEAYCLCILQNDMFSYHLLHHLILLIICLFVSRSCSLPTPFYCFPFLLLCVHLALHPFHPLYWFPFSLSLSFLSLSLSLIKMLKENLFSGFIIGCEGFSSFHIKQSSYWNTNMISSPQKWIYFWHSHVYKWEWMIQPSCHLAVI